MKDKLDFKLTEMNAMPCYIAEPYKVICYSTNHRGQEIPTWFAFHRIYNKHEKVWMFGDSNEYDTMGNSKEYNTKEEAMESCQRHWEKSNREGIC